MWGMNYIHRHLRRVNTRLHAHSRFPAYLFEYICEHAPTHLLAFLAERSPLGSSVCLHSLYFVPFVIFSFLLFWMIFKCFRAWALFCPPPSAPSSACIRIVLPLVTLAVINVWKQTINFRPFQPCIAIIISAASQPRLSTSQGKMSRDLPTTLPYFSGLKKLRENRVRVYCLPAVCPSKSL